MRIHQMMGVVKILVLLSILWAVIALTMQVVRAWGGGRRDFSRRTGSPARGVAYNFTIAMMPANKESIRLHPVQFAIGLLMHVGVLIALLDVVLLIVHPATGREVIALGRPVFGLSLLAGMYLLVHRVASRNLRAMSVPDDYLSNVVSCGLLGMATFSSAAVDAQIHLLVFTAVLLLYLPLGKLRHAVFFFVARGDLGRRLGYRGVYPPAAERG